MSGACLICALGTWLSLPTVALGKEIGPHDVFAHLALLRDEVELIQIEMGKPSIKGSAVHVEGAAPREVYYESLALFRKTNRLYFEHVRRRKEDPKTPEGDLKPKNVWSVLNGALDLIREIKAHHGIAETCDPHQPDETKLPTDVLNSILEATRQINILLDVQFSPSDVYQEVTVAAAYALRLLTHCTNIDSIPKPAPFESRKRPSDVHKCLLNCFNLVG